MKRSESSINFKEVAAMALDRSETLVPQWLPGGKRSGAEWVCGSLGGGPGRSCSVNLATGKWGDFSTGAKGGDLVSLLAAIRGCDQPTAAAEIDPSLAFSPNGNGNGHRSQPAQAARKPAADWVPIIPVPDSAPEPPAWLFSHKEHGPAAASWTYRTRDGGLIGHILRFNQSDGGKEFRPVTWCAGPDGKQEWRAKAFPEPRALFGLETLGDVETVYVVEGEKSVEALRRMLPGECVLTWPGGAKAVSKADFSPLSGRRVVVWPDADKPGLDAAQAIQKQIPGARIVGVGTDTPEAWDAAEAEAEGWTEQDVREFLAGAVRHAETDAAAIDDQHFRPLGKMDGRHYYLVRAGMEIAGLAPSAHTKLNLLNLGPLDYWEREHPQRKGVDWDLAADSLMRQSSSRPAFDFSRVRGRGCWIDGGDVVFHAGGHLIVNGGVMGIWDYRSPSHAVYVGGADIPSHDGPPASNLDGARLIELCRLLPWERPVSGVLLAGWLNLAVICGTLLWRSHLWITGPAGSGKSWTAANIVTPLLGGIGLFTQGSTTEAGLRGELGCDARPTVFDEAESENSAGQARMAKVIEFARQSSCGTGAGIIKGTVTGGSAKYMAHASFLFLSIGVAAVRKADTSRISVLNMRKSDDRENFERLQELCRETAGNPEWAASIRARAVANALTIRRNAEVFSAVAAEFTGDRRSGDQIGTLLAGAWSLTSTGPVTPEAAREYLSKQDLTGFLPEPEDTDESHCYSHLMDSLLTLEHGARVPVGQLVTEARGADLDAQATLKRWGMKLQGGRLWIANRHALLDVLFRDTPWAAEKWSQQLARMTGARKEPPSKFGHMCTQRSVSIPLEDHD